MKKIITNIKIYMIVLLAALTITTMTSCEDYLDKSPDMGMTDDDVFTNYANFEKYFNSLYYSPGGSNFNIKAHFPLFFHMWDQKMTAESLTDIVDMARMQYSQGPKRGVGSTLFADQWGYYGDRKRVTNSWIAIRVCNTSIQNIDRVIDIPASDKNDLLGQAYFIRAFCYFELFRFYGTLPYLEEPLGPEDEWDLPRPTTLDMMNKIAADFDIAADYFAKAGKTRRDPASGQGHLNDPDQDKPNGVAAKAMKSRALLYLASPLNNPSNDKQLWERAALASWEAIQIALDHGYDLLPLDKYTNNYYGTKYTNEQIWGHSPGTFSPSNASLETFLAPVFSGAQNGAGQCPTENFVSRFETKNGFPLYTDVERETAIMGGEFNEQDPYKNRDPRLDLIVIYNQKTLDGYGKASLYIEENGSKPANSLLSEVRHYSRTGYYEHKRTGSLANNSSVKSLLFTDPIIRLGELYLNYAEAANEAWGVDGKATGATMTALEALNQIRARAEMPPVLSKYTANSDLLRDRIKNERIIELCFEGFHYYCDIRRWKDAPKLMSGKLYGIRVTKLSAANLDPARYPTGFKYERIELPADRQVAWRNGMYYVPFKTSDLLKMKNYVPNEAW